VALRRLAGPELAALLHRLVQPGTARRQPLAIRPDEANGLASRRLVDELAPGAAEEAPDWLRVDDRWCATLAVVGYRREVGADWLAALWRCGLPLRVALHLDPLASGTALARLERRRTRLEAAAAVDARQGRTARASAAVALEDVTTLEEAVERGAERLLTLGLYLTVAADAPAALAERVRSVESLLGGLGLRSVRLTFEQPAGYRATLPLGRDEPGRGQALTGAAVAAAFPFAAAGARGDGVLLGVDLAGGGLVELPAAGDAPNRNLAVLGPSGGGKSYAVKAALLRALLLGATVWVVDREGEYAALAEAAGGRSVRLAPGDPGAGLNPLALPEPGVGAAGEPRAMLVAERVATVMALVGLLAGGRDGLTPPDEAAVEAALRALHGDNPPPSWAPGGAAAPTLVDLQRRLARGGEPGRGLAARLARYADGAFAGLFDGSGAVDDARLLRWDLRDLPEELTAAALLLLADAVWMAARRRPGPRLLVIDEAWRLIAHPAGGRFLADLARRARKHDLGLWVASQDVRDLLDDPHGRAIAANAAAALLPPQNEVTIDVVATAFGLGAGERDHLLRAQTGEALLVAGRQRRAVRVLAPPELAPLISTDPPDPAA
jgi:type IV secretory pathway VirB4 component